MARQPATRLQISGHRFLLRRMAHALVRGDVRMLDDPQRAQSLSLLGGAILAVVGLAVCALLAVVKPTNELGDAPIVMMRDSGQVYVRIGDVMHPALNTASARLIAGSAVEPELVGASAIDDARRGPPVGIPGAPNAIGHPLGDGESAWGVCEDASGTTTVMMGSAPDGHESAGTVLVAVRHEAAAMTFLLYDGRRARVDLRNPAVVRALGLEDVAPRQVSRAVLDVLPEAPPIAAPLIADAGVVESILPGSPVGSVVRVTGAGSTDYYVALEHGVQRIGEVAADLIRFTQPPGQRDIVTVAPATIGTLPVVDEVPVDGFPERGGVSEAPVLCARWAWTAASTVVETAVIVRDSLPADAESLALAQADQAGPAVDSFVSPRGRSGYVRAAGITGEGAHSGALYVVTDGGVVFGIRDQEAAQRLGLTAPPVPGPWPLLARLPRGPELSVDGASVMRDEIGPPA